MNAISVAKREYVGVAIILSRIKLVAFVEWQQVNQHI